MDLTLDPGLLKAARAVLTFRTQAFIDGKYCPSVINKTYTSVNPANGKPLAEIADCGPEDVELAVRAARRAFQGGVWSRLKVDARRPQARIAEVRRVAPEDRPGTRAVGLFGRRQADL
ncbi:MAG: aldehyde dehydrogenase family protein [Candidatus Hydrogenedentes bacterium]|nr:aldehyde dehydrogenase family protein [Candidatus Hydrogenedentota bacterium]